MKWLILAASAFLSGAVMQRLSPFNSLKKLFSSYNELMKIISSELTDDEKQKTILKITGKQFILIGKIFSVLVISLIPVLLFLLWVYLSGGNIASELVDTWNILIISVVFIVSYYITRNGKS